MKSLLTAFVSLVLLALCVSNLSATTWYIKPDGTGDAPTVQAGIDSAVAGDTVLVACGIYYEYNIDMKSGITLRSATSQADCAIIDAQQMGRVIFCHSVDNTASIEGLIIINGYCDDVFDWGGGICFEFSSPTLTNCTFSGDSAWYGGGMSCCCESSPTLTYCTFSGNSANRGGGIYFDYSSSALDHCIFSSNHDMSGGGGVFNDGGSPTFTNCTFSGNSSSGYGGGMFCLYDSSMIIDCKFSDNTCIDGPGGGIAFINSYATIANCVLSRNSCGSGIGGGMYFDNCQWPSFPTIMNCSFFGNSAVEVERGGGIYCFESSIRLEKTILAFSNSGGAVCCYGSVATLICCDVYGNAGGDWVGCIAGQDTVNGNFSLDPLFCNPNPMYEDFRVGTGSPCLPVNNSCSELIGAYGEGCDVPVGITIEDIQEPYLMLMQNYPNPFNPMTAISYTLPVGTAVTLSIYDVKGQLVRTLVDKTMDEGLKEVMWDGTDAHGNPVSSGVYFYRLKAGGKTLTKKMILLK